MHGRFAPCVVFDNFSCNPLGVVRGLGRRGVTVHLVTDQITSMAQWSKYVRHIHRFPNFFAKENLFIKALIELGKRSPEKFVLFPTGDAIVLLLSKFREELEKWFVFPYSGRGICNLLINKRDFYKKMIELSVPVPEFLVPQTLEELDHFAHKLGYVGIVKPFRSYEFIAAFGRKCFPFKNEEEYLRVRDQLNGCKIEYLIQDFIPGSLIYMFYVSLSREGYPLALCGYDKVRQFPPDAGSGSFCVSKQCAQAIQTGIEVLTAIGFYGIAEPEFKYDPRDDTFKLLEINARTSTQSRLPEACGGNDVEFSAYLHALNLDVDHKQACHFDEGVRWIYEWPDLKTFIQLHARGQMSLRGYLRSLRGKRVWGCMASDDLKPTLVASLQIALGLIPWFLLRRRSG